MAYHASVGDEATIALLSVRQIEASGPEGVGRRKRAAAGEVAVYDDGVDDLARRVVPGRRWGVGDTEVALSSGRIRRVEIVGRAGRVMLVVDVGLAVQPKALLLHVRHHDLQRPVS